MTKLITSCILFCLLFCDCVDLQAQTDLGEYLNLKLDLRFPNGGARVVEWEDTFKFNARNGGPETKVASEAAIQTLELEPAIMVQEGEVVPPDVVKAYVKRNEELLDDALKQMGPETALRCIQTQNLLFLNHMSRYLNQTDPSFLSVNSLFKKMELTSEQAKAIKEIDQELKSQKLEQLKSLFLAIRDVNLEKMKRFKAELSPTQSKKVTEVIGVPVEWERLTALPGLGFRPIINYANIKNPLDVGYMVKAPTVKKLDLENHLELRTKNDFEERGIEFFDLILHTFLTSNFFSTQMNMSKEQKPKVDGYAKSIAENRFLTTQFAPIRFDELLNGEADYPDELKSLLLPDQILWLRQSELQFYLGQHPTTFGLLHPKMIEHLKLSASVQKQIKAIDQEFQPTIAEKKAEVNKELAVLAMEFAAKRIEVLEDSDKARYQKILGVSCDELVRKPIEPATAIIR